MTGLGEAVVAQRGNSSLAALRRFTELVLGDLNGATPIANDHKPNLGMVFSSDTCDPDSPIRQPFGLVFQEGQRAAFNLPPRRRFVVEYVKITCWATDPHLLVQLRIGRPASDLDVLDDEATTRRQVEGCTLSFLEHQSERLPNR